MKKKESRLSPVGKDGFSSLEVDFPKIKEQKKELEKLIEEIKAYNEKQLAELNKTNPYAVALAEMQKQSEELNADLDEYKDAKEKQLEIDKWYSTEYQKLQDKKASMSSEDYDMASTGLSKLYDTRKSEAFSEVWKERGQKVGETFNDELFNMLHDYEHFEYNMKKVTKRLYNYIIDESAHAVLQQIMGIKAMEFIKNALGKASTKGGLIGASSSFVGGILDSIGKHHSGGVIPVGANVELPGTEEQLALLKGGERILSPAENTDYKSSQGGSSPVVFNNFNIKAWDSKDVQKYLLENKQLLNSITYEGIKNNSSQLRQIVRNA